MIATARYRVGQVFAALRAHLDPPDEAPARDVLPTALRPLFEAMPLEDRRHGLAVLAELRAAGETDRPLLQAALLHDCGKANAGVRLPHRIARVLLACRVRPLWRWLAGWPTGWRRPFWVVDNHPARGAVWIETRGGDPDLVALVRQHECDPPPHWAGTPRGRWLDALQAADALH